MWYLSWYSVADSWLSQTFIITRRQQQSDDSCPLLLHVLSYFSCLLQPQLRSTLSCCFSHAIMIGAPYRALKQYLTKLCHIPISLNLLQKIKHHFIWELGHRWVYKHHSHYFGNDYFVTFVTTLSLQWLKKLDGTCVKTLGLWNT